MQGYDFGQILKDSLQPYMYKITNAVIYNLEKDSYFNNVLHEENEEIITVQIGEKKNTFKAVANTYLSHDDNQVFLTELEGAEHQNLRLFVAIDDSLIVLNEDLETFKSLF